MEQSKLTKLGQAVYNLNYNDIREHFLKDEFNKVLIELKDDNCICTYYRVLLMENGKIVNLGPLDVNDISSLELEGTATLLNSITCGIVLGSVENDRIINTLTNQSYDNLMEKVEFIMEHFKSGKLDKFF